MPTSIIIIAVCYLRGYIKDSPSHDDKAEHEDVEEEDEDDDADEDDVVVFIIVIIIIIIITKINS